MTVSASGVAKPSQGCLPSDPCSSDQGSGMAGSAGSKGTKVDGQGECWGSRQLLCPLPGSPKVSAQGTPKVRGQERCVQEEMAMAVGGRCSHIQASRLCFLAGHTLPLWDCPARGAFTHNGWQTLAFIFITGFKVNGICHIPSWLALMWADFPLPNDR